MPLPPLAALLYRTLKPSFLFRPYYRICDDSMRWEKFASDVAACVCNDQRTKCRTRPVRTVTGKAECESFVHQAIGGIPGPRYADTPGLAMLDTAGLSVTVRRTPYHTTPCRNIFRVAWLLYRFFVMAKKKSKCHTASWGK